MAVVTIRGQLGSGAPEIGEIVAGDLHADFVDRAVVARVADLLHRREQDVLAKEMQPGSLIRRIGETLRHLSPAVAPAGAVRVLRHPPAVDVPLADEHYLEGLKIVIRELAMSQAIVVWGWGSQFILKHWAETFHVLIVAPLKLRVRRVMVDRDIGEDAAKKEIARFDAGMNRFTRKYFKADLEAPVHYDLVVNTQSLNYEAAASIIVKSLPFKG